MGDVTADIKDRLSRLVERRSFHRKRLREEGGMHPAEFNRVTGEIAKDSQEIDGLLGDLHAERAVAESRQELDQL